MFFFLPIEAFNLPSNLTLVDLWNVVALPIIWTHLLRSEQKLRLPYLSAMWLILIASVVSMLWARDVSTASCATANRRSAVDTASAPRTAAR